MRASLIVHRKKKLPFFKFHRKSEIVSVNLCLLSAIFLWAFILITLSEDLKFNTYCVVNCRLCNRFIHCSPTALLSCGVCSLCRCRSLLQVGHIWIWRTKSKQTTGWANFSIWRPDDFKEAHSEIASQVLEWKLTYLLVTGLSLWGVRLHGQISTSSCLCRRRWPSNKSTQDLWQQWWSRVFCSHSEKRESNTQTKIQREREREKPTLLTACSASLLFSSAWFSFDSLSANASSMLSVNLVAWDSCSLKKQLFFG